MVASTGTDDAGRTPNNPGTEPDGSWQRRAVDRAMADARTKALARSSKLMASAMELLEETGSVEFTVQNLVERSELSIRAFYQHFSSKDDLLLALFEELLGQFVEDLQAEIQGIDDPFERLETYIRGFLRRSHLSLPVGGRAWTLYHLRLAVDRPDEFAHAVGPQVELLASIVRHGIDRGVFRTDLPDMAIAQLLNSTIVSIAQMEVFELRSSGGPMGADEVWAWCRAAVAPHGAGTRPVPATTGNHDG